ncbi:MULTISPECIES: ABC transporter permease subunit [unclassified Frigoribacterium]|jgi:putative spermidine/putrescine transport system permease protein|uniref:ABC transporter permease subunit n=1 Tax=unclassified Frigoribacterium TaxID=2627005 RepID=UPI001563A1F3|nr:MULTISPECIES: ABC transporter permease subunit [unclassified Frigoribacterium]MBD8141059.1 ABC transporter permease subunit [Frigoribacterium sp. CFBP 13605]NQW87401.1 ABC transporter permease subunit [Frigoribacterium sp. VKM Ac-2860]NQX09790.1 ABC transporter permease subunit [Frigoribacterium sp. VKM Ac-2859]
MSARTTEPTRTTRTPRTTSAPRSTSAGGAGTVARRTALVVVGALFAVPIAAMVAFSLRSADGTGHDLNHWLAIVDPENERMYRNLVEGVTNSLLLAVVSALLVLVLLVPAMVLVHLRHPRLVRPLEFVCLVPITVPAIVLVVGLAPVYSVVSRVAGSGAWTLALAYGVTVLPYAYRAVQSDLAATDLRTLTEAARTLGSSWPRTMALVVVPSLRRGLLAAAFITVAVVLGEFTIASLLNRVNLQTALVQVSRSDPYAAVVLALISLAFAFVLLLVIGRVGALGAARPIPTRKALS